MTMAVSGGTFGGRFRALIARDSAIRFRTQPPLLRDVRVADPNEAARLARQVADRRMRDEAIAREVKRQQREILGILAFVLAVGAITLGAVLGNC
jgi:hypothetical protein